MLESTSQRYMASGVFSWEFVRGKLRHDPLYYGVLRAGILPNQGQLVDLGCGRGIFLALFIGMISGVIPSFGAANRSVAATLREVF